MMSIKTPWNRNKAVGQKKGFSIKQIEIIRELLKNKKKTMELVLLNIGIDTMLRYSDISQLKISDVLDNKGEIKKEIKLIQKKTGNFHLVLLSENTRETIKLWLQESKKNMQDYIFTGKTKSQNFRKDKLSRITYAKIIKNWASYLQLNQEEYSTHTLRRSRAVHMHNQGVSIEIIRRLLGQKSIESTKAYLGIEQKEAQEINKKYMI